MIKSNPDGETPKIDPSAYIDDTAVVIGNVEVGPDVFVGPRAILRADETGSAITIAAGSNIQDLVVAHAHAATSVAIGENVSLAHSCVVHGPCDIGEGSFVGFGSVIHNATLGKRVFVRHLAVVENAAVPDARKIHSGKVVGSDEEAGALPGIDDADKALAEKVLKANAELLEGYRG